jgi:hypothetical protein
VRLAAAEARLTHRDDPAALAVLTAAVEQSERPELRLLALNALHTIPQKPPASLRPTLERLAADSASAGYVYYLARAARPLLDK